MLVHGIVRRRAGRVLALAVTAVVGTAPMLLAHTDSLLSEFPHAVAIGVFVWWLDRISADGPLLHGGHVADLVVLGVLAAVAYNVRRESIVLIAVLGRHPVRASGSGAAPVAAAHGPAGATG